MSLITPRRRAVQWVLFLALFLLPFARSGGESLLRVDIPSLTLHFFGTRLPIEELYLVGLLLLCLIFLLLLVTLVLGRAWCGWLCPQTALSDLIEGAARRCGLSVNWRTIGGPWSRRLPLYGLALLFSLLIGANLAWYFLSPSEYLARLADGSLRGWPLGATLVVGLLVFFDLVLIRRLACREFCPYGRFQTVLTDKGTLTLGINPAEASRCINCLACLRACPMGIDIRKGFQIECINCASCLDACRKVMARRHQPGLIAYRFGDGKKGWRALLGPKPILVASLFLLAVTALLFATLHRAPASLTVTRNSTAVNRTGHGTAQVVFFTAYLSNRDHKSHLYRFKARISGGSPLPLVLKGQSEGIDLSPGSKRRLQFAALIDPPLTADRTIEFTAINETGQPSARTEVFVPPPASRSKKTGHTPEM